MKKSGPFLRKVRTLQNNVLLFVFYQALRKKSEKAVFTQHNQHGIAQGETDDTNQHTNLFHVALAHHTRGMGQTGCTLTDGHGREGWAAY